jgi:transcriptional regulator with XRE-family HTH domain
MANDLLITAIRESGLELSDIAQIAEVDPRTVQRWLGGRTPHPRYRQKLAGALKTSEGELWPDAVSVRRKDDADEIVSAWAQRNDPGAPDWRALLRAAEQHVDLLGYSLSQMLEARGAIKQLTSRARDGCQIRIAIANPRSEHVLQAELAQRSSGRLVSRITAARALIQELAGQPQIQVREHSVATTHTILRFDDDMLLTIHACGLPGFRAPVLQLRRRRDYGIFDQLARHFEDVWAASSAIEMADERRHRADHAADSASKESMLDQLDYVWRPGRQ